ncbi:hypothetical protein ASG81_22795 [Paenibacillus sp. Soil522]|nr:hypothetical protein ASG81_22795 [Paenibacillus sp. Soil522]
MMKREDILMLIRNRFLRRTMLLILLTIVLPGCWSKRELNTFAIVSGVAVDKVTDSKEVQVTAQVIKVGNMAGGGKESGGASSKEPAYWVVHRKGRTIFDAVQKFSQISNRRLYWSHNEIIIIGQELVKSDGLNKYIDFFVRNPENRPTTWIIISRGKASKILNVPTELEQVTAHELAEVLNRQHSRITAVRMNIHQYLEKLPSKTTAQVIPLVSIETQNNEKLLVVKELAVVKKDKYVGELNSKESRGFQWILGREMRKAIVTVTCPHGGGNVSMEIINSQSKTIPTMARKQLKVAIQISAEADITEQTCSEPFFNPKGWDSLQKALVNVVRSDVLAAVKKGKELNADVFAFGDSFHAKYGRKWGLYERKWDQLYPKLDITVTTETKLRFHGLNVRPLRSD